MPAIVKLDSSYDLWLTYSWSSTNHGICGHVYEVLDYFHILRRYFKVGILLCEDIDWPMLHQAICGKYNFTEEEIATIQANTTFATRPRLVTGRNILFTDGGVNNTASVTLLFDNILYFACGNKEIRHNKKPNTWILQDNRIYCPVLTNGISYKKRILFDRLKQPCPAPDVALVYATRNCRSVEDYAELAQYGKPILAVVNDIPQPVDNVSFVIPPVDDLFSKFSTYIYTPVPRKFDCSPRFIAECKYYDKPVIYHKIDYLDVDLGLYWRQWDIEHDFQSLHLTEADELITILNGIL